MTYLPFAFYFNLNFSDFEFCLSFNGAPSSTTRNRANDECCKGEYRPASSSRSICKRVSAWSLSTVTTWQPNEKLSPGIWKKTPWCWTMIVSSLPTRRPCRTRYTVLVGISIQGTQVHRVVSKHLSLVPHVLFITPDRNHCRYHHQRTRAKHSATIIIRSVSSICVLTLAGSLFRWFVHLGAPRPFWFCCFHGPWSMPPTWRWVINHFHPPPRSNPSHFYDCDYDVPWWCSSVE